MFLLPAYFVFSEGNQSLHHHLSHFIKLFMSFVFVDTKDMKHVCVDCCWLCKLIWALDSRNCGRGSAIGYSNNCYFECYTDLVVAQFYVSLCV